MTIDPYTYRVAWSAEDKANVGLCAEFPSLSWLAATPQKARAGIRRVVKDVVVDLMSAGEPIPQARAAN